MNRLLASGSSRCRAASFAKDECLHYTTGSMALRPRACSNLVLRNVQALVSKLSSSQQLLLVIADYNSEKFKFEVPSHGIRLHKSEARYFIAVSNRPAACMHASK